MKIRAKAWSRLGQNATFGGIGLMEAMKEHDNIQFITADVSTLLGLGKFKAMYPEHYYDVGIAEQNMVTVAAGMALEGNCVFLSTYASFLVVRGLEQIRHNLGNWNVFRMRYWKKWNFPLVYRRYGFFTGNSKYDCYFARRLYRSCKSNHCRR